MVWFQLLPVVGDAAWDSEIICDEDVHTSPPNFFDITAEFQQQSSHDSGAK
jgi:hypothetical protein